LLPNLPKGKDVRKVAILAQTGAESRSAVERFGFETCARDDKGIFVNPEINTVFIATRHNSHAEYVKKALTAGKNVFVEKPLCLTEQELDEISALHQSLITDHKSPLLMLGFNRRFAPLTQMLKAKVGEGPMAMIYRVNAGAIPADSWIQDPELGGGRVIGEVCHFIDLLTYVNGSLPVSVFAQAVPDAKNLNDTLNISIAFANGSIGTVSYFANGSKSLFKEYIEVYRAGTSAVLSDFKKVEIFGKGRTFQKKLFSQDKGQKETVRRFLDAIAKGKGSPIGFAEIHSATLVSFKVLESLRTGEKIKL
jgi:predicted dehydrogenase